MTTSTLTFLDAETRQRDVRTLIGRKTPAEIRDWAAASGGRDWALPIADRLAVSGYLTLADVTESEYVEILG